MLKVDDFYLFFILGLLVCYMLDRFCKLCLNYFVKGFMWWYFKMKIREIDEIR